VQNQLRNDSAIEPIDRVVSEKFPVAHWPLCRLRWWLQLRFHRPGLAAVSPARVAEHRIHDSAETKFAFRRIPSPWAKLLPATQKILPDTPLAELFNRTLRQSVGIRKCQSSAALKGPVPAENERHNACVGAETAGISVQTIAFYQFGEQGRLGSAATPAFKANASDSGMLDEYVGHAIGQAEAKAVPGRCRYSVRPGSAMRYHRRRR